MLLVSLLIWRRRVAPASLRGTGLHANLLRYSHTYTHTHT